MTIVMIDTSKACNFQQTDGKLHATRQFCFTGHIENKRFCFMAVHARLT